MSIASCRVRTLERQRVTSPKNGGNDLGRLRPERLGMLGMHRKDRPRAHPTDDVVEPGSRAVTRGVHLMEGEPEMVEPVVEDLVVHVDLTERFAHGMDGTAPPAADARR